MTHEDPHLAVVHQPRRLLACHLTEVDHVPVTTPSRMVFDVAGLTGVHSMRVGRLLDTCWTRSLVCHSSFTRVMFELAVRGRPGTSMMRELMAERPADYRPPGSNTESRFQELAGRAGLHDFVRQVEVGDDDRWIGRVDFLDRGRGLIVEVDSAMFHGSLTDQRADQVRHATLRAAGFIIESVSDHDLFHRTQDVVARLRQLAQVRPTELVE